MYPGAIGQLLDAGGIVFVLKCLSCAPTLPHTFESAAAFTPHKTFACMHARQGRKASVFSAQKLVVSGQNGLNFKQWSEQRLCCGLWAKQTYGQESTPCPETVARTGAA